MTLSALENDLALLRDDAAPADGCLSDLALDKAVAGEPLSEVEAAHLARCDRCSARRVAFADARNAFSGPPLRAPAPSPAPASPFPLRLVGAGAALLAAAAAVVLVVGPFGEPDPAVRAKGDLALGVWVKRGDLVKPGGPGEVVKPGDQLRFSLRLSAPARVAVLSLDGAGVASVYYPAEGPMPEIRETGRDVPLDLATVLDDTLGAERIYGLACEAPVDLAWLRGQLEKDRALTPPKGCTVDELEIIKR